jgi:hypothetical protein
MGWTVLFRPAHNPDLATPDYRLFGFVNDALPGRHFAHDSELKQSFRDVLRSRGREFYSTGIQRLTQHRQKCIKMTDFVKKIAP